MSYTRLKTRVAEKAPETVSVAISEPIAIIGMASRLPAAPNLGAFWNLLVRGEDAIQEGVPQHLHASDWSSVRKAIGNPDANRLGGFLDRVDEFDAAFFGNSPHEAVRMSPVHRLLMESAWEAIEDSGTPAEALAGSRTSVFTSCLLNSEYWDLLVDSGLHDLHALIGAVMHGTAPGRISHAFDLRGPTMAVDATCAGSLLAVHLACRSIRCGESEMAIVGSVNLQLDALHTAALARGRVISPTGRCRFGDSEADGYVRSDGAVAVVLKPLHKAIADGDRIYASILGSGASSAGSGSSLVAPSKSGQACAIRAAHADAGVTPAEIGYIEAHGTGTSEGDRTELSALGEVLGASSGAEPPCLIGSVKSNVGHTESAAGLTGLIKTALSLRHRLIPPTLHVRQPNPIFAEAALPLRLVDTVRPWPVRRGRRVAGVSSFGMSGTNVHLVVAEAPVPQSPKRLGTQATFVLPVSARALDAVRDLAHSHAAAIAATDTADQLSDICYSAGARRTHHQHRMAVVASDGTQLAKLLGEDTWSGHPDSVVVGDRAVYDAPRVVFVFPGQGSQWTGMGRDLFHTNKVFRGKLLECDVAICDENGWSVVDRLMSEQPMRAVDEIQPLLWAIEVSLAAVWRDWGIEPDLVIGHSMGEIAAATVTGALTVRQGAAVICRRSALIKGLRRPGGMVAVRLGEQEAREAIGELDDLVNVAVINSDRSTVLAGDPEALATVVRPLRQRGIYCHEVRANFASHTPRVNELRGDFLAALAAVRPRRGEMPLHSTVLGCELTGVELNARYWMANLREPVRFADAIRSVLADGQRTLFVEISPHPILVSAMDDAIETAGGASSAVASLHREEPEGQSLAVGLAQAYVRGCTVDWARLNPDGRFVSLPSYPWQRKRFWAPRARVADQQVRSLSPVAEPEPVADRSPAGPLPASRLSTVDIEHRFVELLADLLTMRPDEVDIMSPLPLLGMDSVLAVRLHTKLKHDLGVELPVQDLLGTRTVAEIAHDIHQPPTAV
jgi:acyl transferase domain-containing protein